MRRSDQLSCIFVGQVVMGIKGLQQQTFDVTICAFGDWIWCFFRLIAGLKLPLHAVLGLDVFLMTLLHLSF